MCTDNILQNGKYISINKWLVGECMKRIDAVNAFLLLTILVLLVVAAGCIYQVVHLVNLQNQFTAVLV